MDLLFIIIDKRQNNKFKSLVTPPHRFSLEPSMNSCD